MKKESISLELLKFYDKTAEAPESLGKEIDAAFDIFLEKQGIIPDQKQISIQKSLRRKHIKIVYNIYPSKFLEEYVITKKNKLNCRITIDYNTMEVKAVYYG